MRTPVSLLLICLAPLLLHAQSAQTFCNPIDIDYGWRGNAKTWRHGADPVIVLYRDRYWLFSTWDKPGYRVSDDLVHWTFVPFKTPETLEGRNYTAAAVAEIHGQLYFTEFGTEKRPVALYRTSDPASGVWEKVRDLPPYADPCLFVDPPTERVYMYYGLQSPIRGVELDRKTFQEVPGSESQLMAPFDKNAKIADGWEVCTQDNDEASPPGRSNKTFLPCREGAWMTYHEGKYFLQYASPGTTVETYADGLLIGNSPLGPFTYSPYSPISSKRNGFIGSAGHSCMFQDRHHNWWRAATMLIGVTDRFERRIGIFPAGFSFDNVPFTRTDFGDSPIIVPAGPEAESKLASGWSNLAIGKPVRASSSLEEHPANLANDEDVRTWWSAKTGDAGEWLEVYFKTPITIQALQLNFAEEGSKLPTNAVQQSNRFKVYASQDGSAWSTIIDRSTTDTSTPHFYSVLDKPVSLRFLRVENVSLPASGKFSLRDIRAFGSDGSPPSIVKALTVARDTADRRKVTVRWMPAEGATQYRVRYGVDADHLNQHQIVRGPQTTTVTIYALSTGSPYVFRVDAMNNGGSTEGERLVAAP